jgi:hypothetical protein
MLSMASLSTTPPIVLVKSVLVPTSAAHLSQNTPLVVPPISLNESTVTSAALYHIATEIFPTTSSSLIAGPVSLPSSS